MEGTSPFLGPAVGGAPGLCLGASICEMGSLDPQRGARWRLRERPSAKRRAQSLTRAAAWLLQRSRWRVRQTQVTELGPASLVPSGRARRGTKASSLSRPRACWGQSGQWYAHSSRAPRGGPIPAPLSPEEQWTW